MSDNQDLTADNEITDLFDDQVLITGITWDMRHSVYHSHKVAYAENLPTQFTLNVPENVLKQANDPKNNYNDIIESFVYNFLTHKFGYEVSSCSIWLPSEFK